VPPSGHKKSLRDRLEKLTGSAMPDIFSSGTTLRQGDNVQGDGSEKYKYDPAAHDFEVWSDPLSKTIDVRPFYGQPRLTPGLSCVSPA
jgi:hypothetical protein